MTEFFGKNPILDPGMRSAKNPLIAIWRRRVIFTVAFVSIWVIIIIALLVTPSSYVATGTINIVEAGKVFDTTVALNIGDPADVESQVYIAKSAAILKRILKTPEVLRTVIAECKSSYGVFDLGTGGCGSFGTDDPKVIDYLKSRYSINGVGRSRVFSVSYNSADPRTAQIMANALVDGILANHREEITHVGAPWESLQYYPLRDFWCDGKQMISA